MTTFTGNQITLNFENVFTKCFFFRQNTNYDQLVAKSEKVVFFGGKGDGILASMQCPKLLIQNGCTLTEKQRCEMGMLLH